MSFLFWVLAAGIPLAFYFLAAYYLPFRNTIFLSMPEPTRFFRPPEAYKRQSFGAPIKAGFAKRDITPPRFSWLAGYYPPHPGIFVHDRLWVKSLALQDRHGNGLVIASCDLIGLLPDEIDKITHSVNNVDPASIFISATHTHSGPDTIGLWGIPLFSGKNRKYMQFLRQKIAEAIDESVANLKSGRIRFAEGEFEGYSSGRDENPPDYGVAVMQVLLSFGKPVTLVNFAVHADVVKSFHISADFPHYLSERLGRLTGGEVMFVPGAVGGVQPSGDNNTDSYFVRTLGENLADAVYESLKRPIIPKHSDISGKTTRLNVPLQNKKFLWAAKLGIISNLADENRRMDINLVKLNIGPAEIVTVPGELFPKIWRRTKVKMKGQPKFIFGLTNGELGYILLPEDFDSGKHRYHAGMSVGPQFGEAVDKALQNLATSD
ncbi:MAG: hypothetical protein HYY86_01320 [Candidatus Harrisonbacteria bacterium]|nr:hypothetical protein [Candidatus Harrisonbacteria bacterium]